MLVYLDPSNFAHLELLQIKDPEALTRLLQRWKEKDLRLALSLHHAQEVAQLADEVSRNRRLDVIQLFPKISYAPIGSVTLTEREIVVQSFALRRQTPFSVEMIGRPLFWTFLFLYSLEHNSLGGGYTSERLKRPKP